MGSPGPSIANRRFTGGLAEAARKRAMNRQREESDNENGSNSDNDTRGGKRRRRGEDSGGEMEVDPSETEDTWQDEDMEEELPIAPRSRGSKRSALASDEEDAPTKRTRQSSPPDNSADETDSASRSASPEPVSAKKKRKASSSGSAASSTIDFQSPRPRRSLSNKRPRSASKSKPTGKREIEEVEESTPEISENERDQIRNADSEFETDEEEADDSDKNESTRSKKGKRVRSRAEEEESDGMDGEFEDLEVTSSPPPPSAPPSARTIPSRKPTRSRVNSVKSRKNQASNSRTVGEEWTNAEGSRFRLDADGERRKLCEVRESRKKYKMPKDSLHRDRDVMHEVIVEKWLTNAEYQTALEASQLAWQAVAVEEEEESVMEEVRTNFYFSRE